MGYTPKKHKRKCQYKRANKARTFSLARRFGGRTCPFTCCFAICECSCFCRKSGPNIWRFRGNLIRAMFHSCVMRVAKHGAHRMFAGNLWQSLSCLSSRQLPLQLLTPEHSHSNPKNMNWRNIFLREKCQCLWGLGNWGPGKNRTIGFKPFQNIVFGAHMGAFVHCFHSFAAVVSGKSKWLIL